MAKRPVRIANCSGALTDPGIFMYNQAKDGPVDVITGDYLAEATIATTAGQMGGSDNGGWVATALEGIALSLDIVQEKGIKIVINGGGLNPKGLASKIYSMIRDRGLKLCVAYVEGDNLMHKIDDLLKGPLPHLDEANPGVSLAANTRSFLDMPDEMPIICANAYLGYRAIKRGLDEGADIVICGRVADTSPVMGAAAWWHGWKESDLNELAGSLIAGHLIECSTYVTGGNFAGAYRYPPGQFVHLGSGIAEVLHNGECVITKHAARNGFVTADTVKCQLLYELQGNIYLNNDVKADLAGVEVVEVVDDKDGKARDRVRVSGIRGYPPPPTTKLAIFYRSGFRCEWLINACGYATSHKWDIQEAQMRTVLEEWGVMAKLDVLDFQRIGTPMENPDSQLASTTYMRVFAQSRDEAALRTIYKAWHYHFMSHFAGMHCSLDVRTLVVPMPFAGYYPALVAQAEIEESVTIMGDETDDDKNGQEKKKKEGVEEHTRERDQGSCRSRCRYVVGPPKVTEPLKPRLNYETDRPRALASFGPTRMRPLGDVALGRSGDKGANVSLGLYVQTAEEWQWFRCFMSRDRLRTLMGKDWRDSFFVERVEFPNIFAVHFVVYGPLGRGVSSSKLLDSLGKGFAEFVRAVYVPVPIIFDA